jgi:hypothetical protein
MSKKLLLLCVVGLVAVNVFADHPGDKLGLGIFGGYGDSSSTEGGSGNLGLSLKLPGMPIFWGVGFDFKDADGKALSVSGDVYLFDEDLISQGSFDLDWFLGVGGYGHFIFYKDSGIGADLGIRIPIGLSWHITNNFELFGDVVPGIGIDFEKDGPDFGYVWGGELGLRLWL